MHSLRSPLLLFLLPFLTLMPTKRPNRYKYTRIDLKRLKTQIWASNDLIHLYLVFEFHFYEFFQTLHLLQTL